MSYYVMPYLVDLKQIENIYGSKSWDTIHKLHDEYNKSFAERFDDEKTFKSVLKDIVNWHINNDIEDPWYYSYGLEIVCSCFWTPLHNDETFWTTAFLERIEWIEKITYRFDTIKDFPVWDVYPWVLIMTNEEIINEIENFTPVEEISFDSDFDTKDMDEEDVENIIDFEEFDHDEQLETLEQYRSWLLEAKEKNKDLIMFYY